MPSKSQCILYVVNFAFLAIGVTMAGVAGAVMTHHEDLINEISVHGENLNDVGQEVLKAGPMVALITGVVLVLLGLLGCWAARNFEGGFAKCVLFLYAFIALVVFIMAAVAGSLELGLASELDQLADGDSVDESNEGVKQAIEGLKTLANQTYTTCCIHGKPDTSKSGCQLLEDNVLDDAEACSSSQKFDEEFFGWLSDTLRPIGKLSVAVAVLNFIVMIAACCLVWRQRNEQKDLPRAGGEAPATYYNSGAVAPPGTGTRTTDPLIVVQH